MGTVFERVADILKTIRVVDFIDIIVVAVIIYYAWRLARETRAMQLLKSIVVIFIVYSIAAYFNMVTLKYIVQNFLNVGLIVLVVLFQPELRRALEKIGRNRFSDFGKRGIWAERFSYTEELIDNICKGCELMINHYDGALIVIERNIKLGDVIATGTIVDAEPSPELIANLFFKNSPLHDGAMVIRGGHIYASGCYLPLSENEGIAKDLGTRHRAGLGISEVSDAITIIVSEEKGTISIAQDSALKTGMSVKTLKTELQKRLLSNDEKPKKNIWKFGEKQNGNGKQKKETDSK